MRSLKSSIGNLQSSILSLLLAAGMLAALAPRAEAVIATGGTVTNYTLGGTNWTAHIFTNTAAATSIVFSVGGDVEVLLVGGGGAGRGNGALGNSGDGGSAGQYVYIKDYSVSSQSYPVIVGLGGTGVPNAAGGSGSNSFWSFRVPCGYPPYVVVLMWWRPGRDRARRNGSRSPACSGRDFGSRRPSA